MIFVTGGTGMLGSHLLFDLVSAGKKTCALKRKDSSTAVTRKIFSYYSQNAEDLFNQIEWVHGDILDFHSIDDALKNAEQVYHCAAEVTFNSRDKKSIIRTNIDGTTNMVNTALKNGIKKMLHVSSIAALGRANVKGIIDEECHWEPSGKNSTYSISKYEAEREVWRGMEEGLDAVIVNPSVILGPGDWNKGSSQIFKTVHHGLRFYTKGMNGYVDVRDVSKAMILLMESDIKSERFILSSENVDYQKLLNMMADGYGKAHPNIKAGKFISAVAWRLEKARSVITRQSPLLTKESTSIANKNYFYSSEKIKKAIGFEFIPLEKTVEDCCKFFCTK